MYEVEEEKTPIFQKTYFSDFFQVFIRKHPEQRRNITKISQTFKIKKTKKRPSLPESDISLQLQNGDIVVKGPAEKKHCATNISAKYGKNFGLIKVKVQLN